ncbi:glucose-6-phosphate dehydrogenase assembly protein OpcA [Streptoalloteichus tenebrarius]|uniref:Glucose-6-phosphate dehydrogenase assembly protein OpcA n=1 Tax=Streptoalloteichus tenebrarius (strain ATCC 17920 / DSM 40477 / JCM 4838 / CBS 697.72 / NBRC 16177 / NCIMB 11028 / NRRL B-12390 / A12253. 1 / ISP 5477) TaxID=1933 RepID=A0ABT1HSU9_STRSD|nr:glucose-6-phosphate dehydrogenase assembly protein OpcA [Streptoalloteichus tenebrarius]MCP2258582.1 glucose-6-phosphate dehydrogenase assembly protein OpcA [Streptoalloteichus tenebrarius]
MIIDLPATTTSQVNKKLVELRDQGGAVALGRVLTLVIVTDDGEQTEAAVDAANEASREHPCRVIVVARGPRKAAARLDAQIRVGGDAGASEVIVLRLYGPLADEGASCVVPLLLPDAPVVAWWPGNAPAVPSEDPIGRLATRRITDAAAEKNPIKALETRRDSYAEGDTDLAWTRLTTWRALLASALDLPPFEKVTSATVTGGADSPSTDLLAGWLAAYLDIPVSRRKTPAGEGMHSVVLERKSGAVELSRPDGSVGTLTQPGQPPRRVALQRRENRDCLIEELRRLDPDEVYDATLRALPKVKQARTISRPADRGAAKAAAKTTPKAGAAKPKAAGKSRRAVAAAASTATSAKATASAPAASAGKAERKSAKSGAKSTSEKSAGRGKAAPKPAKRSGKKASGAQR